MVVVTKKVASFTLPASISLLSVSAVVLNSSYDACNSVNPLVIRLVCKVISSVFDLSFFGFLVPKIVTLSASPFTLPDGKSINWPKSSSVSFNRLILFPVYVSYNVLYGCVETNPNLSALDGKSLSKYNLPV